jgi:acetyltransferase-like isoleucine patch superfamily enzyme
VTSLTKEKSIQKMNSKQKVAYYLKIGFNLGKDCYIGKGTVLIGKNCSIGKNCRIGDNSKLIFCDLQIDDNTTIGNNADIRGTHIKVGENVDIGSKVSFLVPEKIVIGKNSNFGSNNNVVCRSFLTGDFTQFYEGITVGGGGKYGKNSHVTIGDHCYIGDKCLLNTSEKIEIGNDVGIGRECLLWTHGAWGPVLQGFPANFAPINIGNNTWIPARTIILPGVNIGSNVVIGTNSLVNKDIPSGSFAAGSPAVVIGHFYPRQLTLSEQEETINVILKEYRLIATEKGIKSKVHFNSDQDNIVMESEQCVTTFNLKTMQISGQTNEASEDLRDFLRRRGIKFFTDKKFKSIIPPDFAKFIFYENL